MPSFCTPGSPCTSLTISFLPPSGLCSLHSALNWSSSQCPLHDQSLTPWVMRVTLPEVIHIVCADRDAQIWLLTLNSYPTFSQWSLTCLSPLKCKLSPSNPYPSLTLITLLYFYHHSIYHLFNILYNLLFTYLWCFPLLNVSFISTGNFLFCSLLYLQCLGPCLAHSRCSINTAELMNSHFAYARGFQTWQPLCLSMFSQHPRPKEKPDSSVYEVVKTKQLPLYPNNLVAIWKNSTHKLKEKNFHVILKPPLLTNKICAPSQTLESTTSDINTLSLLFLFHIDFHELFSSTTSIAENSVSKTCMS